MGDFATAVLRSYVRGGMPRQDCEPRRRALVACPDCGKQFRGQAGVMQHQNAKHGARHSRMVIDAAPVTYEPISEGF